MPASASVLVIGVSLTFVLTLPAPAQAQSEPAGAIAVPSIGPQAAAPAVPPDDPFPRRPQCASMFLKADWNLTFNQRTCDWIQNRMFSANALVGAAWSAEISKLRDAKSEAGDGFNARFARKYTQHIFKSTGSYLGGLLFHEDPRTRPPYLVMKTGSHPHGFFPRVARALGANLISYRCDGARGILPGKADCTRPGDIRKVPAISRVAGALASGATAEFWDAPRDFSGNRALRGTASAYAATFVNAVVSEFSPELNAFAGKTFRALFGGR